MLMVANSPEPPTAIYQTHQSDWSWSPPSTLTDYEGETSPVAAPTNVKTSPAPKTVMTLWSEASRLCAEGAADNHPLFPSVGYRLMRPYQRVATQIPAGKIYSDPWYITVSNIDIWMSRELSYQVRRGGTGPLPLAAC